MKTFQHILKSKSEPNAFLTHVVKQGSNERLFNAFWKSMAQMNAFLTHFEKYNWYTHGEITAQMHSEKNAFELLFLHVIGGIRGDKVPTPSVQ